MHSRGKYAPKFKLNKDGTGSWKVDYGGGFQLSLSGDMSVRTDISARIEDMKKHGVDLHVVSPSPTIYMYWATPAAALKMCAASNDGIAGSVRKHPKEVVGNAIVPLQDVNASTKELDRAISDLELSGVMIGSNINEKNLDDESFTPFFEKADDLQIPIFVHAPPLILSKRLRKYDLFWAMGYLIDESIAVACLIFGGVVERFPHLRFYCPHGGGFIPYQLGRMRKLSEVRPDAGIKLKKSFAHSLRNFYFDTTLADKKALEFLLETVGADRVLYGTNYPAWGEGVDYLENVNSLRIPDDEKRMVLYENALKLFRIKR